MFSIARRINIAERAFALPRHRFFKWLVPFALLLTQSADAIVYRIDATTYSEDQAGGGTPQNPTSFRSDVAGIISVDDISRIATWRIVQSVYGRQSYYRVISDQNSSFNSSSCHFGDARCTTSGAGFLAYDSSTGRGTFVMNWGSSVDPRPIIPINQVRVFDYSDPAFDSYSTIPNSGTLTRLST